jgi:hypothetical protein
MIKLNDEVFVYNKNSKKGEIMLFEEAIILMRALRDTKKYQIGIKVYQSINEIDMFENGTYQISYKVGEMLIDFGIVEVFFDEKKAKYRLRPICSPDIVYDFDDKRMLKAGIYVNKQCNLLE